MVNSKGDNESPGFLKNLLIFLFLYYLFLSLALFSFVLSLFVRLLLRISLFGKGRDGLYWLFNVKTTVSALSLDN